LATVLYRTGFLPNSRPGSLQSRSSVLGRSRTGKHLARIGGRPVLASDYADEIIHGFSRGWDCLVGTPRRRAAFQKRLDQIRAGSRRWIYVATQKYAAIRTASITPAALGSEAGRQTLITRLCSRSSVKPRVRQAEVKAIRQLDLPYFVRQTTQAMPPDPRTVPIELTDAIRKALRWTVGRRHKS